MMSKTLESTTTLNNGIKIPYLGLGTWESTEQDCIHAVEYALTHGYNMIDTARIYGNESQIGKGWKKSGRSRGDIFLTTKIFNKDQGYDTAKLAFKKSLEDLQTDYVDLLLIHWPDMDDFNRTIETWRAMVELQEEGLCRSIGVSNFTIPLLKQLTKEIDVVPAANQVEFHLYLYQKELLTYCRDNQIQVEAYSPMARAEFFGNESLQDIAKKYDKSVAQLMLAWCLQHDVVVIPKTIHENRIEDNKDIFFDIDEEDMKTLDNLGPEKRLIGDKSAPFKTPFS